MTHHETPTHERPDPGGVVRRGEAVGFRAPGGYLDNIGKPPMCSVGRFLKDGQKIAVPKCLRPAVMEVYGLSMCEAHGEEAGAMALEEIHHDLENELARPMNGEVRGLSPHLSAALSLGFGVLEGNHTGSKGADDALLKAFPLDRSRVCGETHAYSEDPDASLGYMTPFDVHMEARMLIHRLMRLAFEDGADWLVGILERERSEAASQAAYALALDNETGRRPTAPA